MSQLVGDYALGALLGRGGASAVYAARHRTTGAEVALKLLHADDGDAAALAEAAAPRGIDHPAVVRVLDAGTDAATGRGYVVMEKVDGESLAERLRRGPLPEPAVRRLGAAIADGMAAAHARGVVHRDLKPANVMMAGDAPRIVDFGIAKQLGDRAGSATVRRIGTPAYMAPEQFAGGLITPAVDVWALGVVLFEAATGALPFVGWDDGRCPPLVDAPAHCGPEVSASFDAIVQRCLARAPGQRFASMAAVAAALREDAEVAERVTEDAGPVVPVARAAAPAIDDATIVDGSIRAAEPASTSRAGRWGFFVGIALALPLGIGALAAPHCEDDSPWRPLVLEARAFLRASKPATPAPVTLDGPAEARPAEAEARPAEAPPSEVEVPPSDVVEDDIELHPDAPPPDRPTRPTPRPTRRDRPRPTTPSGEGLD